MNENSKTDLSWEYCSPDDLEAGVETLINTLKNLEMSQSTVEAVGAGLFIIFGALGIHESNVSGDGNLICGSALCLSAGVFWSMKLWFK